MKLKNMTPMLTTDKLDETIECYTSVLGFECKGHDKEHGWAYVTRWKHLRTE